MTTMTARRLTIPADWENNAPHLTESARTSLVNSIPKYQQNARTRGVPQLGAGLIYPLEDEDILCDAFAIPDHWPRGYALDVGWNRTAVIWRAKDPDTGKSYFYDEHYRSEGDPQIHAAAIRRRGIWIPGVIDPAARGRKQDDGKKLIMLYRKAIYGEEDLALGIEMLGVAKNAVETGLYDVLMAFQEGMLKVMRHRCQNFMAERRLYRRNEKGVVVKKFDHAMDAGRYNKFSGDTWLKAKPSTTTLARFGDGLSHADGQGWMYA
jgi:hypothetical protein